MLPAELIATCGRSPCHARGKHNHRQGEGEEHGTGAAVKQRERALIEQDAHAAEDALEDYQPERDKAEQFHPAAIIEAQQQRKQADSEHADA